MKSLLSSLKERCNHSLLSSVSSTSLSPVSSSAKLSSYKHSSSSCIRNGIGFTLVELMIVIAIIGVLAASLFPMMSGYMAKSRDTARQTNMRQILSAIETFSNDHGGGVPKTGNASVSCPFGSSCYSPDNDWGGWDTSGLGAGFMIFLKDYMTKIPVDPINDNKNDSSTQQYLYYCYPSPGSSVYPPGVALVWRSESQGLWYSALDKSLSGSTAHIPNPNPSGEYLRFQYPCLP